MFVRDMLGRGQVMNVAEALSVLLEHIRPARRRETVVSLEESLGRVCSRDIASPEDLPAFARSTVDGYAVRARDTFGATEAMPAYLNVAGEILMGARPDMPVIKGETLRIPTGGMLPDGADAVVMFEHVHAVDTNIVEMLRQVAPGENVIQAGEDVKRGETLLGKGRRIRPQDIGACAGTGIGDLYVYERPVVSIISTGDEIVPADEVPDAGQVRDINSFIIAGMVTDSGCVPAKKGIFRDEYDRIRKIIETSLKESDVVVLSGGTSVGTKDMIERVLNDIGNPGVLIHGVSLKPGKPMIAGVVGGIPVFGLPGHPAAVGVCFGIFVQPVLEHLSGCGDKLTAYKKPVVRARLDRNVSSAPGREEHIRAAVEQRDGCLWAVPVLGKSGLITTLVKADGTFVIPLHASGVEQGEWVDVSLF